MPLKTKMVIYGALGYFISPIDVIPVMVREGREYPIYD